MARTMHSRLFSAAALSTLLTATLATGSAFAQATPDAPPPPPPGADAPPPPHHPHHPGMHHPGDHLAKLDKDGDGAISREEAASSKYLAKRFDEIDTNKDGKIDRNEMKAHHEAMMAKRREMMAERFRKADRDGDGALSLAEAQDAKMKPIVVHFVDIDANHDGKVTPDEIRGWMQAHRPMHGPGAHGPHGPEDGHPAHGPDDATPPPAPMPEPPGR